MDKETLIAYDTAAESFAREWHEQPPPVDLHGLIKTFFRPGPTADIGCGSGREVAWLCANGFPAIGYDPSEGLLAKARELYLSWRVTEGADRRDEQGRLYAAFDKEIVVRALSNGSFLLDEEVVSASSGKKVHRIIARKEVDATY